MQVNQLVFSGESPDEETLHSFVLVGSIGKNAKQGGRSKIYINEYPQTCQHFCDFFLVWIEEHALKSL